MFARLKKLVGAPEPPPIPEAPAPPPAIAPAQPPEKKEESTPPKEEAKQEEKNTEEPKKEKEEENKEEPTKEQSNPVPAPAAPAAPSAPAAPADPASPEGAGGENQEESPPPVVYFRYTDEALRWMVKKKREKHAELKEKVDDPHASSPEISPPVTPIFKKEEYHRLKEEERIAKEEADKKKAEEAAKKAEEKKKKDEEKRLEAEKKAEEERIAKETEKKVRPLSDLIFAVLDVLFRPVEEKLDTVLGTTIDPFTDRRYIAWLAVVALAYNYNIWFCSARLAFPFHGETANRYWVTLDILSDLVNVVDIMVWQPRLQFVKAGDIVKDRTMTKEHYRKSPRFKNDLICILPFDLLCLYFQFSTIYRLNRFIRVESFFEFSDRLESIMAKAYIWRVARTTGYLLYSLHVNACAYYVASVHQGLGTTTWVYDGKGTAYIRCYYFAVRSLINIGGLPEPTTIFEIAFQMTNFFIGIFVFSSLIGQMRDVIGAATAGQTYFRASMDGCVAYMNTYTIPKYVQNRIRNWYNYTWDSQGMLDESELLDKMPLVMKTAIAVDVNLATFQKIALFQGCDQQMLVDMLLRLKSIIYLPGDFVVKKT
ncbi:cyclic nucleotide-gated channel beta-3-like isoform X2 [Stigmatopora argus]